MHECRGLKIAFGGETSKKSRCNDDNDDNQGRDQDKRLVYQEPSKTITTIFGGRAISKDKWEQKLVARCVMSVTAYDSPIANPKFLPWSEHLITFSKDDQWSDILYPG